LPLLGTGVRLVTVTALEELVLGITTLDVETLLAGPVDKRVDELMVLLCGELLDIMAELLAELDLVFEVVEVVEELLE
jgi:hypothetical protein